MTHIIKSLVRQYGATNVLPFQNQYIVRDGSMAHIVSDYETTTMTKNQLAKWATSRGHKYLADWVRR